MRISSRQLLDASTQSMQRNSVETATWQKRIASGQRYELASQNPAAAGRAVTLAMHESQIKYFQGNQDAVENSMQELDSQITGIRNAMSSLTELSVQARNAANGAGGLNALAQTAAQTVELIKSLKGADNSMGSPMFAETGITLDIEPGFTLPMNVTRNMVFGEGDKGNETVMKACEDIAKTLADGKAPTLEQMTALDKASATIMQAQVKCGIVLNQVDSSRAVMVANTDAIKKETAALLGTDVLEGSTQLTQAQTQLEAARNIFARIASTGLFNKL